MRHGAAKWIRRARLDVALRYMWESLAVHGLSYTMVPPSWYRGPSPWPKSRASRHEECLSRRERKLWTELQERLR